MEYLYQSFIKTASGIENFWCDSAIGELQSDTVDTYEYLGLVASLYDHIVSIQGNRSLPHSVIANGFRPSHDKDWEAHEPADDQFTILKQTLKEEVLKLKNILDERAIEAVEIIEEIETFGEYGPAGTIYNGTEQKGNENE
ncbi:hypothetical protein FGF1_13070 [Flavobacteriaceae bacterium GF1]